MRISFRKEQEPGLVIHAFNPSILEADTWVSEFETSFVFIVNSKPDRAT